MALAPGTGLGPYEILAPLGAGGMGEVYRARDTRLGREVAVKVLPQHLSADVSLRQRFEREARTVSSLNHPHICTLHDIGSHEGTDYLVMELLEGETLAKRLQRGPLPLDQTLRFAMQIADALDKAHRHGVVHRDLKPGNIMLTKTGAKLLDFGLAKSAPAAAPLSSVAPTASSPITAAGAIVGTFQYMAPEQLEGKEADARSDLFSLGAVLYEMITGKRAFQGASQASLIGAILEKQPPPINAVQPMTPPALDRLVRTCLAKDPEERWQTAGDVRHQLVWIAEEAGTVPPQAISKRGAVGWLWLSLAVLFGAGLGAVALWQYMTRRAPAATTPVQFTITLAAHESLHEYASTSVAISPNGELLAYAANRGEERGIYLRALSSLTPRWLAGTERGTNPFFSPDGRWLGFVAGNKLRKVSVDGGAPQNICDVLAFAFTGASWAPDNTIIYVPIFTSGLWRIEADGGKPQRLTAPDTKKGERAHLWPQVLPGGKAALFTVWMGGQMDESRIAVLFLETGEQRVLTTGGFHARYVPGGHIVFARGGTLMAVPFDLRRFQVQGPAVPVLEGVLTDIPSAAAQFEVSSSGSLVYVPGTGRAVPRRLVWVNRKGVERPVSDLRRPFMSVRFSPDGQHLALWISDQITNAWVYQLTRGTLTRVTFGSDDHSVAWSPDGTRVAFESSRTGLHRVYITRVDGTGNPEQITSGEYEHYLSDWSPDGRAIAFTQHHPETGADLWFVEAAAGHQPQPFLVTPFSERKASFSPDGKWLAYVSDESGQDEVYVQRFPETGEKLQISVGGGDEPGWAPSGRELFYRNAGKMMAVPVTTTPKFVAGKPLLLFGGLYFYNTLPNRSYDVAPDGRFVMVKEPAGEGAPRNINVILNWGGELKRLVRPP